MDIPPASFIRASQRLYRPATVVPDTAAWALRLSRADVDMTCRQAAILSIIAANSPTTGGDVARALGVTAPFTSRTVNKLCGLGLVTKTQNQTDRREWVLAIEPAGVALLGAGGAGEG